MQRHMDVSCTFSERVDEGPTDVDWISFWTVEVRKLNVRPDVHPTLYGRICAQWDRPEQTVALICVLVQANLPPMDISIN